jgi:hypothetical protein
LQRSNGSFWSWTCFHVYLKSAHEVDLLGRIPNLAPVRGLYGNLY